MNGTMMDNWTGAIIGDWWLMLLYAAVAFLSWNFTVLTLPLLRKYSVSAPRLNHIAGAQVPGGGGIITLVVIAVFWSASAWLGSFPLPLADLRWLLAAAAVLAVVSWLDDKYHVHWLWRLGLHFAVAIAGSLLLLQWFDGLLLQAISLALFDYSLPVWLDVAFAVLFWVTIINFLNFIDSSDGALASQTLAMSGGVALAALAVGDMNLANGGFIVAAAMLGFLVMNFPPATVFCGNSGAAALGYICGLLLLIAAAKGLWAAALILPACFCIGETVVIVKRALNKQPPWRGSRTNTLHIFILKGFSHRRAFFILSGIAVVLVALATATANKDPLWQAAAVVAAGALCLFAVSYFHRLEPRRQKQQREVKFVPIRRALISVSDKKNLARLAKTLSRFNVEIIASGGTAKAITALGLEVKEVSSVTEFPEIFGGRVKTLHPLIHGGILMRRNNVDDNRQANKHRIKPLDLVVVDLYPFAGYLGKKLSDEQMVEYIDIGGPALLRAAAKNYRFVTVASSAADQLSLEESLLHHDGRVPLSLRRIFAARAFRMLHRYDEKIAAWLEGDNATELGAVWQPPGQFKASLRYGENPHQRAELHQVGFEIGLAQAKLLQGKSPSYNNYQDGDAALRLAGDLATEFPTKAAAIIIKHATPGAVAVAADSAAAWRKAYEADSESAFGGICAFTKTVDADCARRLAELFLEVVIAPNFHPKALEILKAKKNLRLFKLAEFTLPALEAKRISGGWLVQQSDLQPPSQNPKVVTAKKPPKRLGDDLSLAWLTAKHTRSNAVVIVKDGVTLGIGGGQTSRVEAVRQAVSRSTLGGAMLHKTNRAVAASDGFFPFADSIKILAKVGIKAVIQPGGARRDDEVIAAADEHKLAMLFTAVRHFKH